MAAHEADQSMLSAVSLSFGHMFLSMATLELLTCYACTCYKQFLWLIMMSELTDTQTSILPAPGWLAS